MNPLKIGKNYHRNKEQRAIQIGMKDELSRFYVENAVSIEDVTAVAHCIAKAHEAGEMEMDSMDVALPMERPYFPRWEMLRDVERCWDTSTPCSILKVSDVPFKDGRFDEASIG